MLCKHLKDKQPCNLFGLFYINPYTTMHFKNLKSKHVKQMQKLTAQVYSTILQARPEAITDFATS